jgi:hypothetical protein
MSQSELHFCVYKRNSVSITRTNAERFLRSESQNVRFLESEPYFQGQKRKFGRGVKEIHERWEEKISFYFATKVASSPPL